MNAGLVALLVAIDVLVTAVIIVYVMRRRGPNLAGAGEHLHRIGAVSAELERRIEEVVRSQWSGDPATLAPVITSLVSELESDLHARQLPLDRAQIRMLVARSIESKRLANGRDVREALKQVS